MWGETNQNEIDILDRNISTHSPRVGRDCRRYCQNTEDRYFNPLSPCGERLIYRMLQHRRIRFQPTLPVWGETYMFYLLLLCSLYFNPLSPCGERRDWRPLDKRRINFNPLSPCGERLTYQHHRHATAGISTHSPRVGRDLIK